MNQFQSLGRDSVHSSGGIREEKNGGFGFQSLGRDSVHSSMTLHTPITLRGQVSIPRSGFCSFKPTCGTSEIQGAGVSIPRSGFCSFKPELDAVGAYLTAMFQSLGRDSVHSSRRGKENPKSQKEVSIPRSGFCSFKLGIIWMTMTSRNGFNPSVGILFIQADDP